MSLVQKNSNTKFLYVSLSVLPVFLIGVFVYWQYAVTLNTVIFGLLLLLCVLGNCLYWWHLHVGKLTEISTNYVEDQESKIAAIAEYTTELERLLLTISPILSQQVMVSREHTEQEIISLTNQFSSMVNELRQIVDSTGYVFDGQQDYHLDSVINTSRGLLQPVLDIIKQIYQTDHKVVDDSTLFLAETNINQTLTLLSSALTHYRNNVEALRNNAEQISCEINKVLVALQFQDRVSQILFQVENNLLNLQKTIENIQQQGTERNGNMLQVDEAVEHIEEKYKSVSSNPNRVSDNLDDLTFF